MPLFIRGYSTLLLIIIFYQWPGKFFINVSTTICKISLVYKTYVEKQCIAKTLYTEIVS